MHLFHLSCLLLSWVLESVWGDELIDLGPDGGTTNVTNQRLELVLGAAEDSNFRSLSAL